MHDSLLGDGSGAVTLDEAYMLVTQGVLPKRLQLAAVSARKTELIRGAIPPMPLFTAATSTVLLQLLKQALILTANMAQADRPDDVRWVGSPRGDTPEPWVTPEMEPITRTRTDGEQ
jgi:hypothetical protein